MSQANRSKRRSGSVAATYVHLDVTSDDSWRAAVATTERLYGKLNVLCSNAGIYIRKRIEDTTEGDWSASWQ